MRKPKNIAIEEIAHLAGVSTATVSRVINNKPNVREDTRQRVMDLLLDKGYIFSERHKHAQSNTHPSHTIVILTPDVSNPFNSMVIDGVMAAAKLHGYQVIVTIAREIHADFAYYESLLRDIHVAGIIALAAFPDVETARQVNNRWPVVMCSEYLENSGLSYVGIDDVQAGARATQFLIGQGRKQVALINGTLNRKYARDREAGYMQALGAADQTSRAEHMLHLSNISYGLALPSITALLQNHPEIDAVFACSDVLAAATIEAARRVGRSVPGDIAIIGFDNIDLAVMTSPHITTISQPSFDIGYHSCEVLVDAVQRGVGAANTVILSTDLIVRGSA